MKRTIEYNGVVIEYDPNDPIEIKATRRIRYLLDEKKKHSAKKLLKALKKYRKVRNK